MRRGGEAIGVIGSNRTTNEENYLLQKFARTVLKTNNIDHRPQHGGMRSFASSLAGQAGGAGGLQEIAKACAVLLVGGDPTEEHPLLAWTSAHECATQSRTDFILANSKVDQAGAASEGYAGAATGRVTRSGGAAGCGESDFSKGIAGEESLVVIFGEECRGQAMANVIAWGLKRGNVRFALLGDHSNFRGAADMGLSPDLLPGYVPVTAAAGFEAEYVGLPRRLRGRP